MGYISEKGLQELLNYKYVSGGYSIADKLFTPFWNWFIEFIPLTVAPNMLTLIALFWNLSAVCIFIYLDNAKLTEDLPLPCILYACFCLFMYQTFDAIDGK